MGSTGFSKIINFMSLIDNTIVFIKQQLQDAEGGHDWFHIERVYKNALLIAQEEVCDIMVVKLAALLHDIADSKFHPDDSGGDEEIGPQTARKFLESKHVSEEIIEHVFKSSKTFLSKVEIMRKPFHPKN